jgi:Na+/proline symporter
VAGLSDARERYNSSRTSAARIKGYVWFRTDYFLGLAFLHSLYGVNGWFRVHCMLRVQNSDDFATAHGGYGPVFLALAMTATAASGATFLGMPALAYSAGISSLWQLLYPFGVYIAVWVSMVAILRGGEAFGSRTIAEYLGDRYKSDALRLMTAGFSMLLLFYLAGQLLSGALMFYNLLALETVPALIITAFMLMSYVAMGGAHADILSD